ncbi:MAG: ankyrin repeat domain-containing protein [Planctomycetota bacterium]|jgi:hypothetical protein
MHIYKVERTNNYLLLVLGLYLCFFCNFVFGVESVSPITKNGKDGFTQVNQLTRQVFVVSNEFGRIYKYDSSSENVHFSECGTVPIQYLSGPTWLGCLSDGSKFYLCDASKLYEISFEGKCEKELHINEFNLGKGNFSFQGFIQATDKRLWLKIYDRDRSSVVNAQDYFFVEWPVDMPANKRFVGPRFYAACSIDPLENQAFLAGGVNGIFRYHEKSFIPKKNWISYQHADYSHTDGLLLSGDTWKKDSPNDILWVDSKKDKEVIIQEGSNAFWGIDGWIYFLHKKTQLRRCKPESPRKKEIVYDFSRSDAYNRADTPDRIWIITSSDQSCILLMTPFVDSQKKKQCVLIDIKNQEYKEFAIENRFQNVIVCVRDIKASDISMPFRDNKSIPLLPIYEAIYGPDSIEEIKQLLVRGMDINSVNEYGKTALYSAVGSIMHSDKEKERMVRFLLENGADVNIKDGRGCPLLLEAVRQGCSFEILDSLVEHGINVNEQDDRGTTALHWAVNYKKVKYVKYLISNGADPLIQDSAGYTPLTFAKNDTSEESKEIVKILQKEN